MKNEIMVLTKEEIERNPEVVGENLAALAAAIEESRNDITEIQNRGFFKRLMSNNTRDLAEAMLKQNEIIGAYITVVQGIIWLTMNNIGLLATVMDAMNKSQSANGIVENNYTKMAKDYMTEAIKVAEKNNRHDREIAELKSELDSLKSNAAGGQKATIALVLAVIAIVLGVKSML